MSSSSICQALWDFDWETIIGIKSANEIQDSVYGYIFDFSEFLAVIFVRKGGEISVRPSSVRIAFQGLLFMLQLAIPQDYVTMPSFPILSKDMQHKLTKQLHRKPKQAA